MSEHQHELRLKLPSGVELHIAGDREFVAGAYQDVKHGAVSVFQAVARQQPQRPDAPAIAAAAPSPPTPATARRITAKKGRRKQRSLPPPPAPGAVATPAAVPDLPDTNPKRAVLCQQLPGNRLSIDQAAQLAGRQITTIYGGLSRAKDKGQEWASIGDFSFQWEAAAAGDGAASAGGDARPRWANSESQPLNQNIVGRAAKHTPQERPTPSEYANV
jgi:hypothetical protein